MSTGLLALLDDIATLLDDMAVLSKAAAQKTAGIIGDDLAVNAEQVSGIRAERELPVVWAVTKGSLKNKVILVPLALIISAVAPWAIPILLVLGGFFLCFEGMEKVFHALHSSKEDKAKDHEEKMQALLDNKVDLVAFEKEKIKGAIRTDFILSAEIVVIILGTVATETLPMQIALLSGMAVLVTLAVYGIVAGIVKLDDAGFYLLKSTKEIWKKLGGFLLWLAPFLMRNLAIVGTAAMFLVGGGILVHNVPFVHHLIEVVNAPLHGIAVISTVGPLLVDALVGMVLGLVVVAVVTASLKIKKVVTS